MSDRIRERAKDLARDATNIGEDFAYAPGNPSPYHALYSLIHTALLQTAQESRREALEDAAQFVQEHYPVHVTGPGPSRWVLDKDSDGGKIQSTYAQGLRALIEKEAE